MFGTAFRNRSLAPLVGLGGRLLFAFCFNAIPNWASTNLSEDVLSSRLDMYSPTLAFSEPEVDGGTDKLKCWGKKKTNSRGAARDIARAWRLVVREVVRESSEAGDRFLRLLCPDADELDELLLLELDDVDEEESLRRNPLPRAHRVIACSMTEGIMLKPIPLEEDDELEIERGGREKGI